MMTPKQIQDAIESQMPGCTCNVFSDDLVHYEAHVIYAGFVGKSRIQQHRMVYAALGDAMAHAVHALQLTTEIPKEEASS